MKKARITTMTLCIAAAAIISGYIDIFGGISIIVVNYEKYGKLGIALLISSFFLISGTILAIFEKVWLPAVFNIIGTVSYIYTVSEIYAIPNTLISKTETEPLAERHLLTVIVTVLLAVLTVLNYFSEKNTDKRAKKRQAKHDRENRKLKDSEKIV
ncbi:MAG: hypothetical protein J1F11_10980 [Oscillospiraceae bacterium]|nr:hypothetical protein [Oscillospiraceae bacterium]